MQQRLQESAVSPTVASDDSQDVESGVTNQIPSPDNPTGTSLLSVCACIACNLLGGSFCENGELW